jgi:hypothetical protein
MHNLTFHCGLILTTPHPAAAAAVQALATHGEVSVSSQEVAQRIEKTRHMHNPTLNCCLILCPPHPAAAAAAVAAAAAAVAAAAAAAAGAGHAR